MQTIVVDLMGSDNDELTLLPGAIRAINENNDLKLVICGKKDELTNSLSSLTYDKTRLEIIDSGEPITNEDNPTKAFMKKADSSLVLGLNAAKGCDGFVSCGSTGAVLVSSIFILGKINDIRPALSACLKSSSNKDFLVVDCGANVDTKVEHLVGFAKMGEAYMEAVGVNEPRIALLSNGSESKKGNQEVKEAHELFTTLNFNFVGNIEGKDVMADKADVIVCDGFSGNVVLKTIEGAAKTVFTDLIKIAKKSSPEEGKFLMKTVQELLNKYDYNSKGGATLLGVNKPVVKGHGAANADTVYSCINQCYILAKNNLISKIISKLN